MFFDGTNNNRDNIEEREKNSDIYKKYRKADGSGSYDNGRTNIAIMEPYVSTKKADYAGDYDFVSSSSVVDVDRDGDLDIVASGPIIFSNTLRQIQEFVLSEICRVTGPKAAAQIFHPLPKLLPVPDLRLHPRCLFHGVLVRH